MNVPRALAKAGAVCGLVFSLAACETAGGYGNGGYGIGGMGPKETGGALIGAAAGGLIGSQFGGGSGQLAATAVGTLAGALIGAHFGRSMDRADMMYAERAHYGALDSGRRTQWRNPQSGHYGHVEPGPSHYYGRRECREYSHTVYLEGYPETVYGTACREPDGSWRVTNS